MVDDTSPAQSADIVDFAAFRARRQAEQASLFDGPAEPSKEAAWPAPGRPFGRPMTSRALEHRERMLRHLAAVKP